jgi:non-specific serine/threonine protein kinase
MALLFSGWTEYRSGDFAAAGSYLTRSVACARAAGAPLCEPPGLNIMAMIACDQGDYPAAQPLAEEAVRLARATGDIWNEGWALGSVGRAALGRGALDDARAALEAGHEVARQQSEMTSLTSFILNLLGELRTTLGQLEQAGECLVTSVKLQHAAGERLAMTQSLERLAALDARRGQTERALWLAGAADALYDRLGIRRPRAERQKLELWLLPMRDMLGSEAVEAAWQQGRALELEDAIALALRTDEADTTRLAAPLPGHARTRLTAREQEVAELLARGLSNRQIAERLVIAERTVASHIEHILEKLGFASRHQVGAWMVEHGPPG